MINWHHYSKNLPALQFVLLNIGLGIGHFIAVLSAGAFLPMLPYVAGTIGEGLAYAVWGQSNYLAAMGAAFLIARPLMKRFGARNTAIAAYLLFALSCCDVLLSTPHYTAYVVARTLQGFSAGLSIIPSLFLLMEQYKPAKHKFAIALWSFAAFTPFSVGPALGGFFTYIVGDWRVLFVVFLVLSLLVTLCIGCFIPNNPIPHQHTSVQNNKHHYYPLKSRVLGFACVFIGILCLQGIFNLGIITSFSSATDTLWIMSAVVVLAMWLFWVINSTSRHPLIELSIFKYRNYTLGLLLTCLAFMCVQAAIVQYIIRMQTIEGFTAWHVGLLFLPIFLFSKPLSVVTQHIIHRGYDPRFLASLSFLTFAITFWWIGGYMRPATWQDLLWPQFLEGAALGVFLVAMNSVTLSNVPESLQLQAVDMLNGMRTVAAGLAISISDIVWDRHVVYVRDHLLASDSGNMSRFLLQHHSTSPIDKAMLHQVQMQLVKHSGWITFNSFFQWFAIAFIIFMVAVWFINPLHLVHTNKNQDLVVESLGEEP
ncbi:MAG: MFS transporter [Moraxellaceae bacterium]|nr:MAG: MFS transporter [Moraxellaceae bacterium]